MTSIHVFDITCSDCKTNNYVNNGDIDDMTVCDVDVVLCWECGYVFAVDEQQGLPSRKDGRWADQGYPTADAAMKEELP